MTIQDQYTSSVRQATETWAGVAESFNDTLQKAESFSDTLQKSFAQTGSPFDIADPKQAIDQVFDFWEKTLAVQRDVAKEFIDATIAATEKVRSQAESFGSTLREQTETVTHAVRERAEAVQEQAEAAEANAREQAEAAERAEREQAAKKYDDMTKPELQDELAGRDLPKTGTAEELRERLVADDQK